jgi:hypothetical protein
MTQPDNVPETKNSMRFNEGKPHYGYIHFKSLLPMVRVLEYGAKKYDLDNWKNPPKDKDEHLQSMLRHLIALLDGEVIDHESGLPHIGHIMCNAMFHSFHTTVSKESKKDPLFTQTIT